MWCKRTDGESWTTLRVRALRERLGVPAFDAAAAGPDQSAWMKLRAGEDLRRIGDPPYQTNRLLKKGCIMKDDLRDGREMQKHDPSLAADQTDRALVLCVHEKTQTRSPASGLMLAGWRCNGLNPLRPSRRCVRTSRTPCPRLSPSRRQQLVLGHRYQGGKVISQLQRRHRPSEFCQFLDTIEANVPAELEAYLVMDNFATHKTAAIQR